MHGSPVILNGLHKDTRIVDFSGVEQSLLRQLELNHANVALGRKADLQSEKLQ